MCAVVAASTADAMHDQLKLALAATRTIELRLDWLESDGEIGRFIAKLSKTGDKATLIATCRRREAGGQYAGTIANELFHLAEAIRAGCTWYDLEIETLRKCPAELIEALLGEGKQLRSAHFFDRIPGVPRVLNELSKGEPDAIKIAVQCDSLSEARNLVRFSAKRKNLIAIPMGEVALPARILNLKNKNGFAYAPVENATAPGQTSLRDLADIYRADRMGPRTSVYGVIGDPVMHSLSPAMQNAGFARKRMNAVYLPFLVRDLGDFIDSIEELGIRGFSVTIPHKERILRFLDDCDPLAARIGAVNTVIVRAKGKLQGYNTDYVGVLRSLEQRIPLRGSRVLVLGAGGAARAVAFALAEAGTSVCVCTRRLEKAKALAKAVGGEAIQRWHVQRESFDAIVNATPVGMHPHVDDSPLEANELNCRLVFDTIYRPRETRLLQLAKRRGIETVSGVDMFVAQGTAQFEIWTGSGAPSEVMRRAVMAALAKEEKTAPSAGKRKGK
jgi:3-dehydroquinate dehydratase / shikimate dehydrogenase